MQWGDMTVVWEPCKGVSLVQPSGIRVVNNLCSGLFVLSRVNRQQPKRVIRDHTRQEIILLFQHSGEP